MKENKYDHEEFFNKYQQMSRSIKGLSGAGEWHIFQQMMPSLVNKKVLDLGCGFGWHCRYAIEKGASFVVGVDISAKMLAQAKRINLLPKIEYVQLPIEDIQFETKSFDVVISSLTLHYVQSFSDICKKVYDYLTVNGTFIFSVEHPIFTANHQQQWYFDKNQHPLFWPIDNYFQEQVITANFLGEAVLKYHRTLTTYINTLILQGFKIKSLVEPFPSNEALTTNDAMKNELRRPMMLIISATKSIAT